MALKLDVQQGHMAAMVRSLQTFGHIVYAKEGMRGGRCLARVLEEAPCQPSLLLLYSRVELMGENGIMTKLWCGG